MSIDVRGILGKLPEARKLANLVTGGLFSDPQRSYMFELRVMGRDFNTGSLNDIRFYVKSAVIPQYAVDHIRTNFMGNQIIYNGKDVSSHVMTVTCWDDENLSVYSYFRKWMEIMRVPVSGQTVSKSNYATDVLIKLKDASDLVTTAEFKMIKAFPIEIGEVPLSYDGSDPIEIPIIFMFEETEIQQ